MIAPEGPVYQAGTLAGNPLAMTAGIETLRILQQPGFYTTLDEKMKTLCEGLAQAAAQAGVPITQTRVASMSSLFFTNQPATSYAAVKTSDTKRYAAYFHHMLDRGVYFAPSQFEAAFVSQAHSQEDLEHTIEAARDAFKAIA